jgi:hypothetical protein
MGMCTLLPGGGGTLSYLGVLVRLPVGTHNFQLLHKLGNTDSKVRVLSFYPNYCDKVLGCVIAGMFPPNVCISFVPNFSFELLSLMQVCR